MSLKSIFIALFVLIVLVAILIFGKFAGGPGDDVAGKLTPGFEEFKALDASKVERFTIAKGDAAVEVKRQGEGWILATSYGYPADKEKVEKLFQELEKIEDGEQRGWSAESHPSFEVDEESGTRLDFYGAGDQRIAAVVLGKNAPAGRTLESYSFARFGGDDEVYVVEGYLRSNAGGSMEELEKDYFLSTQLFKIPDDHETLVAEIIRPDHNVILERRHVERPKPAPEKKAGSEGEPAAGEEGEKKDEKPEMEKVEEFYVASGAESFRADSTREWDVKSYLNNKELRVKQAIEMKDLSAYGLDQPHLRIVLRHRKKDDPAAQEQVTAFRFGNAIKEEKPADGGEAADAAAAEDKAYYVLLEGEASGGRIYTVEKWDYGRWNKDLPDFKPRPPEPPKEETKEAEKKDGDPAAPGSPPEALPGAPPKAAEPPPSTSGAPPAPIPVPAPLPAPAGEVRASHILIPYQGADRAPPATTRTKEEARQEAERILAELKKAPETFEDLARAHSSCPSSVKGGDLGSFPRGMMAKPFEDAAFSLQPGQLSGVVETGFGFHVIQRTE